MNTDKLVARISAVEQNHLDIIADSIRRTATCHADRFPTRSSTLRAAIRLAAEYVTAQAV